MLEPFDHLAILRLLNGDMGHGRCRRCPMPVLLAWREPHHVSGTDVLNGTAPALSPPAAEDHDQCLAKRMGVPRSSGAWLEGDAGASRSRRSGSVEQRIDARRTAKPVLRSFPRGLRTASFDLHGSPPDCLGPSVGTWVSAFHFCKLLLPF